MTKRMSNIRFAVCLVGFLSGVLLLGSGCCNSKSGQPDRAEPGMYDTIQFNSMNSLTRVEYPKDNTICYVYNGYNKGGVSCVKY